MMPNKQESRSQGGLGFGSRKENPREFEIRKVSKGFPSPGLIDRSALMSQLRWEYCLETGLRRTPRLHLDSAESSLGISVMVEGAEEGSVTTHTHTHTPCTRCP